MKRVVSEAILFVVLIHGLTLLSILGFVLAVILSNFPLAVSEGDQIGLAWAALITGIASLYLTPFTALGFTVWLLVKRRDKLKGRYAFAWAIATVVSPTVLPLVVHLILPIASSSTIWTSIVVVVTIGLVWTFHFAFGHRK